LIRESDEQTYTENLIDCDGSQDSILSAHTCSVPVTSLKNAPYSLPWGAHVYAKVIATNLYGSAEASEAGNGAMITTYPDPPTDLTEDYS
jgi:hypothetical protein